jgi:diguanylate cyclase (GGDEF)-like protein
MSSMLGSTRSGPPKGRAPSTPQGRRAATPPKAASQLARDPMLRRFAPTIRIVIGVCLILVLGAAVGCVAWQEQQSSNEAQERFDEWERAVLKVDAALHAIDVLGGAPVDEATWPPIKASIESLTAEGVSLPVDDSKLAAVESSSAAIDAAVRSDGFVAPQPVVGLANDLRVLKGDLVDPPEEGTKSIGWLLVAVGLAVLVLVLYFAALLRSFEVPARQLAQAWRRFSEGDTRVRAPEHPDGAGVAAASFNSAVERVGARMEALAAESERAAQMKVIKEALDRADSESEVARVVERALGMVVPGMPGELLVAAASATRLEHVSTSVSGGAAGCPVQNPADCQAMRHGQTAVFRSPGEVGACPKLIEHGWLCSAVCVPVAAGGRLVGVLHVTADPELPPDSGVVEQLESLAGNVGSRTASLRAIDMHRQAAATDPLTRLGNRRAGEGYLRDLVRNGVPFVVALLDIDNFKQLNDQYGHETGDSALKVFAEVLRANVRGNDMIARFGGEEFVLVYPQVTIDRAMEAIERFRVALPGAVTAQGLPRFTVSAGVTTSQEGDAVEEILRVADAGLLMAKELGRNRVVYSDRDLVERVFGGAPVTRSQRRAEAKSEVWTEPVIDLRTLPPEQVSRRGRHARPPGLDG